MKFKGIQKGDQNFRHFTFDENDYIKKDGIYYYRVNYGKNKLEGPDAEDEIGYVPCAKVMPIGGKGPSSIPGEEKKPDTAPMQYMPPTPTPQQEVKPEPKKRGRPAKVKALEPSNEVLTTAPQEEKFEYMVENLSMDNSEDLKRFLNDWGNDGWELCWFEPERSIFGSYKARAIFKRKRG